MPDSRLEMDFVYGYHNSGFTNSTRSNTFYLKSKEMIYHAASLVIMYDKESHSQVSLTQSPLALRKTRILAMNPAKWLQT